MNTKEKILTEALNLFSLQGYEAVSIRDIGKAVGIKESSIYNHYKNKRDIFDTIVAEGLKRSLEYFHRMELTGEDRQFYADERTVEMYKNMTADQFEAVAGQIFEFIFTDDFNVKLRRMLTIEQYRSGDLARVFRDFSFDSSLTYQSALFAEMIRAGIFVEADPYVLALEFFSPIFLIFYKFDNDPQSMEAARELFTKHIRHFSSTYTKTIEL